MDPRPFATRSLAALLLPAALIAYAPAALAQEDDAYAGERTEHYASVRLLEGEATIRKDEVEDPLSRGVPVAEGDVVESRGRGVLQLADGTRIAFGPGTRFQVASLYSEQDREPNVLLRLDYGRLRLALGREARGEVRIDTPSGSALLAEGAEASLEVERDRTARVKVHSGRMVFSNERDRTSLLAGERLTVFSDRDRLDRVQGFNTYGGDAFDTWADRQLALKRGPGWDKVPAELRYYSDDLDEHGEWVWVDEYRSWCWRPLGVAQDWRPYWQGRWGAYPGGMTWISDEPWGYVTYHHGRWGWTVGLGWYWIPAVAYAPAWVAWHSEDVYFGWAPLGFHGRPVTWGYGSWRGDYCWNVVEINFIHMGHLQRYTRYDPYVHRHFQPGPAGNRPLSPPWRQTPLIVHPREFQNPAELRRVSQDARIPQERFRSYTFRPEHPRPAPSVLPAAQTPPNRPLSRPQPGLVWNPPSSRHEPAPGPVVMRSEPPRTTPPPPVQPQQEVVWPPPSRKHDGQPVAKPDTPSGQTPPPYYLPPPLKKRPLGRP